MGNNQTGLHYATGLECALDVSEDREAAMTWLNRSNSPLANRRLIDVLATEQGSWEVRRVLNAIATGGVV
jgi:uncharacterized protein (DUF2384 family)